MRAPKCGWPRKFWALFEATLSPERGSPEADAPVLFNGVHNEVRPFLRQDGWAGACLDGCPLASSSFVTRGGKSGENDFFGRAYGIP